MERKKLYTDLVYTTEKNKDTPQCHHFSLRGYVAEMRQKNPRLSFPFSVSGSETQPSLPPLVVRKFPSWSCNVCRGENVLNITDQSDQRTSCKEVHETLTHKSVPATKEIVIRKVIDLTGGSEDDHMPINEEENNDAHQVSINEITDVNPDMENDLNLQVSNNVGSLDVYPSLIQEVQEYERGIVASESEAELVVNNVTTKDKSSSNVADKGKQICEDNQSLQDLRKTLEITEKDIMPENNAEQFPQEPATADNVDAGNSDENGENENEIQDLHQKKSSNKFKRIRLLREILREDDEPVAEDIRSERPALQNQNPSNKSADSERQKTVMDKVVGEGGTKKLEKKGQPGRKRKLVVEVDEDDAPLTDFTHSVENHDSDMSVYIVRPLAQIAPNEEGLEEGMLLSSNSSRQTLLRPVQEGSGGETDSTGELRFPLTSAFSREGTGVRVKEIDEATREQNELEALEALLQISQINVVNEEPESLIKQLKEMNFDQYDSTDGDMLNGNIGVGVSMDLNVATGGSDSILQKLNPGECSKTKMNIIGTSQTYGSLKGNLSGKSHASAIFDQEKEETPTQHFASTGTPLSLNNNISESFCVTNRNPSDFTQIEAENPYMRKKKDEVRKRVSRGKNRDSSSKQNKKQKKP